jgi:hypothetical protein
MCVNNTAAKQILQYFYFSLSVIRIFLKKKEAAS